MTPEERLVLARLADELVPAAGGMPAASEVGLAGRWIDRALKARPDLLPLLQRALARVRDGDVDAPALAVGDPEAFRAALLLVTGAYYMHPKVRKLIGYPGQRPTPIYPDEAEHDLRDGLLDPVIERGPIFRPAP